MVSPCKSSPPPSNASRILALLGYHSISSKERQFMYSSTGSGTESFSSPFSCTERRRWMRPSSKPRCYRVKRPQPGRHQGCAWQGRVSFGTTVARNIVHQDGEARMLAMWRRRLYQEGLPTGIPLEGLHGKR
jgi:hypothetical protein